MIRALARAAVRGLVGCRHTRSVRERRTRFGCAVLHYRCLDCGHVAPIVERSEAETRALFEHGDEKAVRP